MTSHAAGMFEETVRIDCSITKYPLSKPYAFGTDDWLKMTSQEGLQVILVSCITVTSVIWPDMPVLCYFSVPFLQSCVKLSWLNDFDIDKRPNS